jgi:uncharacterized protein (DUF934 family)
MPLIKEGRFVEDSWRHLTDDEALPAAGNITLSFARWTRERDALAGRRVGVRVPNDVPPSALHDLAALPLIVLHFPKFTDGRAYSQARLLRSRWHFRGELRATGNVLRDQLLFMQRCGFDCFEVPERAVAEDWLGAFREFDMFYQPASDGRPWVAARRRQVAGATAVSDQVAANRVD